MRIDFKIKNDMLVLERQRETYSGNVNFYECSFDIQTNQELVWLCVFKKDDKVYQQVIENGVCMIPQEVLFADGELEIGCYAASNTEKFQRISTNWVSVKVSKGAYSDGTAPKVPEKDVWETLMLKNVPYIGENGNWYIFDTEKLDYIDSGRSSVGEKGEKGDRGETGLPGTTNAANALKGKKIGQNVTISDVSPIEHDLDVKVKSKNISIVTRYANATGTSNLLVNSETIPMEVGKVYTASWDTEESDVRCWFTLYQSYREFISQSKDINACDGTRKYYTFKIISKPGGLGGWALQQANSTITEECPISNFMLEEGEVATEYTPYVQDVSSTPIEISDENGRFEEVYPQEDGILENIVSSYPSMNIKAKQEGVVVDVSYNRDINKAFMELEEKMTQAIISLGGNV